MSNPVLNDDTYNPVVRNRAAECARCEAEIPGYREAHRHLTWSEVRAKYLADPEVRQAFDELQLPERKDLPTPAVFDEP